MKIIRRIVIGIIVFVLLAGIAVIIYDKTVNNKFTVTHYQLESEKIKGNVKIALLSDLHNHEYGDRNWELVSAIRSEQPDFIVMCGDMVMQDDPNIDILMNLCKELKQIADIYFIYGNHEGVLEFAGNGLQVPLSKHLYEAGVNVCWPGDYEITVNDSVIDLFSISIDEEDYRKDTETQDKYKEFLDKDTFKIAASHYPQILYETFYEDDFDLGIAGHFHGGQIILPKLGGVYHKDTGFFPEYYGGEYKLGRGILIISRGLGDSSALPRINNQPELVMIEISNKED